MKAYFAYARASTTREGEEGVSLHEQRAVILEYASKRELRIGAWLEEQQMKLSQSIERMQKDPEWFEPPS